MVTIGKQPGDGELFQSVLQTVSIAMPEESRGEAGETANGPSGLSQPCADAGCVAPFLRVCLLPISRSYLAVELNCLCEIVRAELITPVPDMPETLAGVMMHQGAVIPVVDVRLLLDRARISTPRYVALVRRRGGQIGVLIDDVPGVETCQMGDVQEHPFNRLSQEHKILAGFVKVGMESYELLDAAGLFATLESMSVRSPTHS
ncbi:MAG: chemotaxis protein CheW [Nitrospira sp.]|nr:chemotaxis protein CheW [Nitrospira sp.]